MRKPVKLKTYNPCHERTLKFKVGNADRYIQSQKMLSPKLPDVKVLYMPHYEDSEDFFFHDKSTNRILSYAAVLTIYLTKGHPQRFQFCEWDKDFETEYRNRSKLFKGITPNFCLIPRVLPMRTGRIVELEPLAAKSLYGNGFIKSGKTYILFFQKKELVNYFILNGEIHADWYETLKANNRLIT